jgi:hypothetical protein
MSCLNRYLPESSLNIKLTGNTLHWFGEIIKENEGTIKGNIGRSLRDRQMMDVFEDGSHGKEAITHYRVLRRFHYVTLNECNPRDRSHASEQGSHETYRPPSF